jgi:hypothetical protein
LARPCGSWKDHVGGIVSTSAVAGDVGVRTSTLCLPVVSFWGSFHAALTNLPSANKYFLSANLG